MGMCHKYMYKILASKLQQYKIKVEEKIYK